MGHLYDSALAAELSTLAQGVLGQFAVQPPPGPTPALGPERIAALIDHTLLKPEATPAMIDALCAEAREFHFASVCVNPFYVRWCARWLSGSGIPVCSVIGFPLGASTTEIKAMEAQHALEDGAREIDMVINVGMLVAQTAEGYALVQEDIAGVVRVCHDHGALCKVIIEAALLSDEQKVIACLLAVRAGADYCKTSTGFGPGGATAHDVALMRLTVGPSVGIKAAGGVRDYDTAMQMVRAGASRIGASAGVRIVQQAASSAAGAATSRTAPPPA